MHGLDGRVVVVTGAGRGIGREHALLLAAHGAKVVVNDLGAGPDGSGADASPAKQVVEEIIAAGGTATANTDDVADADGAENLIDTAVREFGRIDALINNAGILRDRSLVNMSDEEWDVSIRVNLRGCFLPSRAVARRWREASKAGATLDACIVNTSSESGVFANAGQSNYAAAKSGVATLTEVWSKELGRYGVKVNAILPRARTRLTDSDAIQAREGRFDHWDPSNVAPFVAYLASTQCAPSGEVFLVGGGTVQRCAPWTLDPAWQLKKGGRWDIEEIAAEMERIGVPDREGRDTGYVR
jgi:NAD(P)-dependent dehydrogenase (short-subunit alcohol dehydrogenase family)